MKTYLLVGPTCECQDSQHGRAPAGWCQHRLAAAIHTRVGELLPAAPQPVPAPPPVEPWPDNDPEPEPAQETRQAPAPLPEARSSANVRLQVGGREVQITLRDH